MIMNMEKLRSVKGYKIGSVTINAKVRGVATIPADGFQALVGYMGTDGKWIWVRKDFCK